MFISKKEQFAEPESQFGPAWTSLPAIVPLSLGLTIWMMKQFSLGLIWALPLYSGIGATLLMAFIAIALMFETRRD